MKIIYIIIEKLFSEIVDFAVKDGHVSAYMYLCREASLWVWLVDSGWKGLYQATESSQDWEEGDGRQGGCTQMALGPMRQWRSMACAEQYPFLCQKKIAGRPHGYDSMSQWVFRLLLKC